MASWQSTSVPEKNNCWSVCCKKECVCSSLGLNHAKPPLFAESLWQSRPNISYVAFRIVVAVYFLPWLVLSGVGTRSGPTWFIFFTNWSFLLLTTRLLVQAYIALAHYIHHSIQGKEFLQRLNWIMKTEWVLYNVSSGAALVASVLFWFFLYLPAIDTYVLDAVNIHTHGINSAVVFLDIWIAAIPLRFLHFFQTLGFVFIYFIFNAIYVFAGGRDDEGNPFIYEAIDFLEEPAQATILVTEALALTLGLWIVLWLMSWMARGIVSCCCPWRRQRITGGCGHHQPGCVGCGGQGVVQGSVNHGAVFTVSPGGPHVSTIHV